MSEPTEYEKKYQNFECGCALRRNCVFHDHSAIIIRAEQAEKQLADTRELLNYSNNNITALKAELAAKDRDITATRENAAIDIGEAQGITKRLREELAAKDAFIKDIECSHADVLPVGITTIYELDHKYRQGSLWGGHEQGMMLGQVYSMYKHIAAKDARIRALTEDLCRLDPSYKL